MQRIEHYEIAAYGTDVALAEALGEKEVASLLSQTLEEEKQTDLKLTEVTQQAIMLGTQLLLGLQYRAAFADAFNDLPLCLPKI